VEGRKGRFQKFSKLPGSTGKAIRQASKLGKWTPPHKTKIFPVRRFYRHRVKGILEVDGGHVTVFFSERDDCVEGVHLKMGFAGVLIEFL